MRFTKYTKEQLIIAVKESTSIRQALIKLKVRPHGGNYRVINNRIKKLQLDTSHFTGQGWNRGRSYIKRPLEDYLSNKQEIQSYRLKNRLLKEGIFEPCCFGCSLTKWRNKQIPLELDHIDGNNMNNSLDNLRLLCPNCHAQTHTYRGKNQKRAN